ncbi:MAG TPA: hypothetical protein VMV07_06170, partial [Streptosporangiaceae bacterium]|nr:hypothetical protein [Streptosporangiaceae bacterium]
MLAKEAGDPADAGTSARSELGFRDAGVDVRIARNVHARSHGIGINVVRRATRRPHLDSVIQNEDPDRTWDGVVPMYQSIHCRFAERSQGYFLALLRF